MATQYLNLPIFSAAQQNSDVQLMKASVAGVGGGTVSYDPFVWDFSHTANGEIHFVFTLPEDFVGTAVMEVYWTSPTNGASNVVWEMDNCEFLPGTDAIDAAAGESTLDRVIATNLPGAADRLEQSDINITETGWAAGDVIGVKFRRDALDTGNDTKTDTAQLYALRLKYSDA